MILIILVAAVVYLIAKNYEKKPSPEDRSVVIGFVVPTLTNPYFVDMTNAARTTVDTMQSVKVIIQAPQSVEDALVQNQMMENLITQKVSAICVVPTNSGSIIPVIKEANAAGIPVINIDNKADMALADKQGAKIATYIGSDNFAGGQLAARFIVDKLGGKGKVAILEGISGNDAAIKRKGGFLEGLKTAPGIMVVASQVANWNREQAFNIFQNILKSNPGLNAVFACNDEMALGAYRAMVQAKIPKSDLVIVGFDAIPEAVTAVNAGNIDATIAQQPALMGAKGVLTALDIIGGAKVDSSYSTELKVIKK